MLLNILLRHFVKSDDSVRLLSRLIVEGCNGISPGPVVNGDIRFRERGMLVKRVDISGEIIM